VTWSGKNRNGRPVPKGYYFFSATATDRASNLTRVDLGGFEGTTICCAYSVVERGLVAEGGPSEVALPTFPSRRFVTAGGLTVVHEGLLGDRSNAVVAPHEVSVDGPVLRYAYGRPDAPNTGALPVFAGAARKDSMRRTRYALHLPYTSVEHIDWGGADGLIYLFASQPVASDRCVGYCVLARNYDLEQPDDLIQAFQRPIFGQDQRVVASQRPDRVPFDVAAELHLTVDAVAVAYRRAMRAHGFGSA